MHRIPRWARIAAIVPLGILVLITAAWAVDAAVQSGRVSRHVTVAGEDVGGVDQQALAETVDRIARSYEGAAVTVETPNGSLDSTVGELGVALDDDRTEELVDDTAGGGLVLLRPFRWLGSFVGEHEAPLAFEVDRARLLSTLAPLREANAVAPVEPGMRATADGLELIGGEPGTELDTDAAVDALARAAKTGDFPAAGCEIGSGLPSRAGSHRRGDAGDDRRGQRAGERAPDRAGGRPGRRRRTSDPVHVVPPRRRRRRPHRPTRRRSRAHMARRELLVPARRTRRRRFHPRRRGCADHPGPRRQLRCAEGSVDRVRAALEDGSDTVTLDLEVWEPARDTGRARELGIVEPVASFTTNHASGQSRVVNIQRMADIVRGAVIEPGETFSINEHVGRRTREKGFLPAGVIVRRRVRGGCRRRCSQFATTWSQRRLLRGARVRGVPESLDLHLPVPVRTRGDGVVPRPRPRDRQQLPARRDDLDPLHAGLHHRRSLVYQVGGRPADRADRASAGPVHPGHHGADPDLGRRRATGGRLGVRAVPAR
ncbi:MAG: VanW family protein [Acidimicrobiia bacterium]|nr:VanW family protein [Acidimicrobiia bacterium]